MKIKTEWDLKLLYKSEKDPRIEKDLKKIERACAAFEKKYKGKDFTSTPQKLLKAIQDREKLSKVFNGGKPHYYFELRTDLNSNDSPAGAASTKNGQRLTKASNMLTFFDLAIGKIPKEKQGSFLKHPLLKPYAYKLKREFMAARYNLSEGEEQVIDLLSLPGYYMWVDGQSRVLANQTIEHKGGQIPLPKALDMIADLPLNERRSLKEKIDKLLMGNSDFADAEINAVVNFKKITDERRSFAKPYSARALGSQNEESEIETLVKLVSKHFKIAHRFYRLQAKLLGLKRLHMEDRAVKLGKMKRKFSFNETLDIVGTALGSVDPGYKKILEKYAGNGQIDVYPKKGKTGGAYCSGAGDMPVFILLNHADSIRSVETLGHEMGHAIHTELARSQPWHYHGYSLATAETASTFFEQVTMLELEKSLSGQDKIISLHNRILGDIASIFRQIACFNFEVELHEQIRKMGKLPKGDLANLMRKHLESYLGEAVDVTHEDGYFFVYWSHIRRFFYVYTYAYGQLISRALFEKWKENPSYAKKIEQFLRAGSSMSPKDIFKSIGIDTTDPKFFEAGLKGIEKDIARLEKLTSKLVKKVK